MKEALSSRLFKEVGGDQKQSKLEIILMFLVPRSRGIDIVNHCYLLTDIN